MRRVARVNDAIKACSRFAVFAVLPAILLFCQPATSQTTPLSPAQSDSGKYLEHLVPFVPTPLDVAQKMLEVAKVQPDDVVYDLGSGDGRIVILAAQKFGAHAVGVELNSDLYAESSERIRKLGLQGRAQILHENMFEVNVRHATVVTLYLLTAVNERLRPMLTTQLRSGARIVSHDFQIPGWQPAQTVDMLSKNGVPSKIFLYVRP
ncbi:MAG: class I SAM-dependent methyltransferase [Terriglobia bacterium]|jgi:SAM-dependent methyltransferase